MNTVKYDILKSALQRIAKGQSGPLGLVSIAVIALRDAEQVVEFEIIARTWYGKNGGEYKVSLHRTDTRNTLIAISGTMWGNDAWAYDMRDAMHLRFPSFFPEHDHQNPTIYFRDICKVEYHHTEVSRKRDL